MPSRSWRTSPAPSAEGETHWGAPPAFYPGVPRPSDATVIRIGWGEIREGVDIRLGEHVDTRVEAALSGPFVAEGCGACRFAIYSEDSFGLVAMLRGMAVRGAVAIEGLPPGSYLFALVAQELSTHREAATLEPFEVIEDRVTQLHVMAADEQPLRGRLVLEDPPDDLPQPWSVGIRLTAPRSRRLVSARPQRMSTVAKGEGMHGTFELASLEGRFWLELGDANGAYIAGVSVGGRPLASPLLTIPKTGLAGEAAVRVRFDGGLVRGHVEDPGREEPSPGLAPSGYLVRFDPASAEPGFLRSHTAQAGPDGAFQAKLPPGLYDAVAVVNDLTHYVSPLADSSLLSKSAKRIEVKPNETSNLTLAPVR